MLDFYPTAKPGGSAFHRLSKLPFTALEFPSRLEDLNERHLLEGDFPKI